MSHFFHFYPLFLVPHFHVSYFHLSHFQRPPSRICIKNKQTKINIKNNKYNKNKRQKANIGYSARSRAIECAVKAKLPEN